MAYKPKPAGPLKVASLPKLTGVKKLTGKSKAKADKAAGLPSHGGNTTIGDMMRNMVG